MTLTDKAEIKRLMDSAKAYVEVNAVKMEARALGYDQALSLYGVIIDNATGHAEYRRIEVYSNTPYTGELVELIYRFFQKIKPSKTYTIWLYDSEREALKLAGAFD